MEKVRRVISKYLYNVNGIGHYVLDVGTGSAIMALSLAEMGIRCITIEKSQKAFKEAKKFINKSITVTQPLLMNMDARKMDFIDNTFDCVVAYRSMHHIENAEIALNEMFRVCKPGGKIIIIEHNKNVNDALDIISAYNGEKHPNCIDTNEIICELNKKNGNIILHETEIGWLCEFTKSGNIAETHLDISNCNLFLGSVKDKKYYFDYKKSVFSYYKEECLIPVDFKIEKSKVSCAQTICLNLANQCNLNCSYCYADGGNYGNSELLMKANVAQKGIDRFIKPTNNDLHVILFGGEPLINKSVIKEILNKNGKTLTYSINTNATLLDEDIISILVENGVKISISIDGTRNTHDSQRKYSNEKPTYDVIVNKLKMFSSEIMEQLWARVTVTNRSISIYEDIMHLLSLGFKKIDMSFVAGNKEFSENKNNIEKWMDDIDRLAATSIELWLNNGVIIYPFTKVYQSMIHGLKAQTTCTAGREMLSIQPDGKIVPCFKFNNIILGDLENKGLNQEEVLDFEHYKGTVRKLVCEGCWAYEFCGGLCPKDINTIINIQEYRCMLIQYLVRRSLLYFCDFYVNEPQKFNIKGLQYEMRKWIDKVRGGLNND